MSLYQWSWDNFIQKDFWTKQCRGKLVFSDLGRRTATAALRRGTWNKESRTARVKSTMFIVTYTRCNTHPHKITEAFVMLMLMCHCHLQISRHNHFKEWPWTGWRLDLTPKKAPERGKRNVVLISCCSTDLTQQSKKSRWPVFLSLWRWPNWHEEGSWPSSDQYQYKWNPKIGQISEEYSGHLILVSWPISLTPSDLPPPTIAVHLWVM